NISYGGDPAIIPQLPGYAALKSIADEYEVELMHSMMSPPAAVGVGAGALSLAYCGDAGEFTPEDCAARDSGGGDPLLQPGQQVRGDFVAAEIVQQL
ncbi:UNVERIFIED_CONTAM: hypothetical protein IGO34_27455, partial [Salmonella enterica subsp. enterica serovar Weltevreden]